jgi:hypothetical protein
MTGVPARKLYNVGSSHVRLPVLVRDFFHSLTYVLLDKLELLMRIGDWSCGLALAMALAAILFGDGSL